MIFKQIRTVALIPAKVNFTLLSRYGAVVTAKTFASNFKTSVDWNESQP
ncbi:hypothetical protein [Duncaniella freteri]